MDTRDRNGLEQSGLKQLLSSARRQFHESAQIDALVKALQGFQSDFIKAGLYVNVISQRTQTWIPDNPMHKELHLRLVHSGPKELSSNVSCRVAIYSRHNDDLSGHLGQAIVRSVLQSLAQKEKTDALFCELVFSNDCLSSLNEIMSQSKFLKDPISALDAIMERLKSTLELEGRFHGAIWQANSKSQFLPVYATRQKTSELPAINSSFKELSLHASSLRWLQDNAEKREALKLCGLDEGARSLGMAMLPTSADALIVFWSDQVLHLDHRHRLFLEAMLGQLALVLDSENLVKKVVKTELLQKEMKIAGAIQHSLLFDTPPENLTHVESAVFVKPSRDIGGDFFEFLTDESESAPSFDLVLGDVMGKGVAAGLAGAALKTEFLRAFHGYDRREGPRDLAEILSAVHGSTVAKLLELNCFATVCYARFDSETGVFSYLSCGQPRPLLYREATGEVEALDMDWPRGTNLPLGLVEDSGYLSRTLQLNTGDAIFLYSDGLTEARNSEHEEYGEERLIAQITKLFRQQPKIELNELIEQTQKSIHDFAGQQLHDDVLFLGLRWQGQPEEQESAEKFFLVDAERLEDVRAFAKDVVLSSSPCIDPQILFDIQLALTEAASNIVKHGIAHKEKPNFQVTAQFLDSRFHFQLQHRGHAFQPMGIADPDFAHDNHEGCGLYLIHSLMENIHYFQNEHGFQCLTMEKGVPHPSEALWTRI